MYSITNKQIFNADAVCIGFVKAVPLTKLQWVANAASLIGTQLLLPRSYASFTAQGHELCRTLAPTNFWSSKYTLHIGNQNLLITNEVDTLGRVTHHFTLDDVPCHIASNFKEEYSFYINKQLAVQINQGKSAMLYIEDETLLLLFASLYFTIYQGGIR